MTKRDKRRKRKARKLRTPALDDVRLGTSKDDHCLSCGVECHARVDGLCHGCYEGIGPQATTFIYTEGPF